MGDLWRSEEMNLVQLFVQIEAARDTVDELGKLGVMQFKDLNPDVTAFQRNFVNEVKRADEMERKLRYFEEQIVKEKEQAKVENRNLREKIVSLEENREEKSLKQLDELEVHFEELEKEVQQMNSNQEMLNRNFNELVELQFVLLKDSSFFEEAFDLSPLEDSDVKQPLMDQTMDSGTRAVKLGFITGVISRKKFSSFERVLWRVLRGNLFMKYAEIEQFIKDPHSGEYLEKNVFIVFFQGERSQQKIKKICDSFNVNVYPIPESYQERKDLLDQVKTRLQDLEKVLEKTRTHRVQVLLNIERNLGEWKERVLKEKAIYHTMNMFNYDVGRKLLIAEGWCPLNATEKIINAMRTATTTSGALVPSVLHPVTTNEEPPTYFKTNKFTYSFQAIVEAYGVAQYREVNPTVLTIITFPFLFAVMFGDLGHGFLMTLFAGYLIWKEKELGQKQLNEIVKTCFDGRYVLILMGLFSMYTGLLYNECFSVPMDIFGTTWELREDVNRSMLVAYRPEGRVYPFGVDPAWKGSANMLQFYNSLKMKMSIIFGVTQMCVGICMSLVNGLHFKKPLNIFGEFIPQILFMLSIFGYMVFLIFFKWAQPWTDTAPPFLLNVMIQMFLSPYKLEAENQLFDGQFFVQLVFIVIALICIPWMLFVKPYVLKSQHQTKLRQNPTSVVEDSQDEEFDFGEIFVKQVIHTIEFVLGAISNTASYLRLWALSLAHAELSEVFWDRVLIQTYSFGGFYMVFAGFAIWAVVTFGVLMVMESLSSFLHALRLHWVEFQNKFYHGDGYKFMPFSYQAVIKGEED